MSSQLRAARRASRLAVAAVLALAAGLAAQGGSNPAEFGGSQLLGVDQRVLLGEPRGRPLTGEELDRTTAELSSLMRCPVCQGLSVNDSPTDSALAMKREVRELLAAGYTSDQVFEYFERSYGEFIRLAPKRRGFNWAVWLAPPMALVVGGLLVAMRIRGAASRRASGGEPDELAEYLERVRREVGA